MNREYRSRLPVTRDQSSFGYHGVRNLYISGPRSWPLGNTVYVLLHLVVGGAIGLLVAGSKSSAGPTSGTSHVGAIIFMLIWVIVVGLCILSYRYPKKNNQAKLVSLVDLQTFA